MAGFKLILSVFAFVVAMSLLKRRVEGFQGPAAYSKGSKGCSISVNAMPCERNARSCSPCDGSVEGMCRDNGNYGWNNSISADLTQPWAPHNPDGRWRAHKMPNYYGMGSCAAYSYGEPYYARSVKY